MTKVMVFGTFDGLHDGHRDFFRQALQEGDYLIAVAAPDQVVFHLKGRLPAQDLNERLDSLLGENEVHQAVAGDEEISSWSVVRKHKPSVIALGYDQEALRRELEFQLPGFEWGVELKTMQAHAPHLYHSSLLRQG